MHSAPHGLCCQAAQLPKPEIGLQPLVSIQQSLLSLFAAALFAFTLPAQHGSETPGEGSRGEGAAGHPPAGHASVTATPTPQQPVNPAAASAPQSPSNKQDRAKPAAKKPKPKPGIPVEDLLVRSMCSRCHALDDRGHMTRISYLRKSPEGWAQSIKRMGRLHGLQLTPATAKMLVRSLSNSHGLARAEAERALYESERRVHWSEESHDSDFRQACAQCHPLGRALLQYRDNEEWQLLRATHVAMFPLSRGQIGGGPPRENRSRGGNFPSSATGSTSSNTGSTASASTGSDSGRRGSSSTSVGDRVLDKLSQQQPLLTPEWEAWAQNRREVPLQGYWTVHGHETGRGDVIGTLQLTRTDEDEYDLNWNLRWSDGSTAERSGKGVLYAGYSWRGRSRDADGTTWREVLLLDQQWQSFKGRLFTGSYDEIGVDVTLERDDGRPHIVALLNGAIEVPPEGQESRPQLVDVIANTAFPKPPTIDDFFVGKGLTITKVERIHDRQARLTITAQAGTALGSRLVAYGNNPGGAKLLLYDTVDYVRVRPLQGLARTGGAKHPRQIERFEAYAVHRGKDGKPYTSDDVDLFQVRGKWALSEFAVRDDDDDLKYVGTIDAASGVFTPNVDGPNPARKWQANNIGDVFVTFEATLDVAVRPPEKKPSDEAKSEGSSSEPPAPGEHGEEPREPEEGETSTEEPAEHASEAEPVAEAAEQDPRDTTAKPAPAALPAREQRTFFARSHLLVTVPIYARWQVLDWEDR
jgi:quinohemoprotein amine dehydrogenase